jgi:hypothetical protein
VEQASHSAGVTDLAADRFTLTADDLQRIETIGPSWPQIFPQEQARCPMAEMDRSSSVTPQPDSQSHVMRLAERILRGGPQEALHVLAEESPPTIASVLSALPAGKAVALLPRFEAAQREAILKSVALRGLTLGGWDPARWPTSVNKELAVGLANGTLGGVPRVVSIAAFPALTQWMMH